MTKSCSNCLHHDVCHTAQLMLGFAPGPIETYNQFASDLREFLGEHCPHYRAEEKPDEQTRTKTD